MSNAEKDCEALRVEVALLKNALLELRRERDHFASLVESTTDEIWFCDAGENLRPQNQAARESIRCMSSGVTQSQVDEATGGLQLLKPGGMHHFGEESPLRIALRGEHIQWEEIIRHPESGELHYKKYKATPIKDEHGAITGAVAIARDMTKARRTEADLRESNERFRVALAHAPVMVFEKDMDLRFTWAFNPPFGFTAEEIVGKSFHEFIKIEDAGGVQALVSQMMESGQAVRREVEIRFQGLETCWDVTIEPRRDELGEVIGFIGVAYDMTERKLAEKALAVSGGISKRIFHMSPAIMGLSTVKEGVYLDVNAAFTKVLGFAREEAIGKSALELGLWAEPSQRHLLAAKLRESGSLRSRVVKFRSKSGEIKTVVISAELMEVDGQQCILAAASDFTSHQKRHNAVRKREAEFRAILDNTSDMITRIDRNLRYLFTNKAVTKATGLLPKEIIGKTVHEFFPQNETLEIGISAIEKVIATGKPCTFESSSLVQGRSLILQVCLVPEFSRMGEVETVLGICRDITELKQTEAQLRKSKEHFQLLYESVPLGYQSLDEDSRYIEVNHAWLDAMGYAREEVLGRWFGEFMTEASSDHMAGCFGQFKQLGEVSGVEFEMIRKDGSRFMAAFYGKINYDEQGRFQQTHCIMHDITARKQAEADQLLHQERLEALLQLGQMNEATEDEILDFILAKATHLTRSDFGFLGFITEDERRMKIPQYNKMTLKHCGIGPQTSPLPVDLAGIWSEPVRLRKPLVLNDFSAPHPAKKGLPPGHVPVSRLMAVPIFSGGKIVAMAAVANKAEAYIQNDVTQLSLLLEGMQAHLKRRRAEEEIKRARAEAEMANKAKSNFLAHMSHELRTPLNGVLGMVDLAHMTCADAKPREYLKLAKHSGHMLLDIINDILDLAKIEAGKVELETKPFDVREVLDSTIEPLALLGRRKGLKMSWFIDPQVPDRLEGDEGRLRQVLTNLVGNALKFTEQGSISINLSCDFESCPSQGARLLFSIADTGVGIPRNKLASIYDSFSQAITSAHTKYGGTGLGLTISKCLVEMMGGTIKVESVVDRGSTFRFTVICGVAQRRSFCGASTGSNPSPCRQSLRVLVAEDNEVNQVLIRELLRLEGHAATVVGTGIEALEALRQADYDIVLMDIRMPDMDGVEALRRIRSGEAGNPHIPVIALTAYSLAGDKERFLEAGMDGYLAKPIVIADFNALLQQLAD